MSESTIEGLIEGGKATAGPPLGPALGPMGINVNDVIGEINQKTAAFAGIKVPVKVIVDTATKRFRVEVGMPPTSALLLKEINVQKGAKAKGEVIGNVTLEQIKKVIEAKSDSLYGAGLKEKVKQVLGTCVSMGITCENMSAKEFTKKDRLRRDKALITEPRLRCIYLRLCKEFGTGSWWPAETKDEVFISAILTQQTQWHNVQISMRNLKEAGFLSVKRLASADLDMIEQKIRPSGFYHQKAARLKGACTAIESNGGLDEVFSLSERRLYQLLISINGIGRETADSIILYGAGKPALVVDNYTWRIVSRLYGSKVRYDYSALKSELEEKTRRSVRLYRNMHAQFVELGKKYCTKNNPKCVECPISKMCDYQKNRR